jgi:hypothetical protein
LVRLFTYQCGVIIGNFIYSIEISIFNQNKTKEMRVKMKRLFFIIIVMIIISITFSASAQSSIQMGAELPWSTQLFKDAESGVKNLSTAFVGLNQIPMLSYSRTDFHRIYQAHKATTAVPGNCGLDDSWYCDYWEDSDLIPGTVSQMATHRYINTHAIRWAFATSDGTIRGATIELKDDMSFVTQNWGDLIQISKFGASLVGTPSLQITSGGQYVIATTILGSSDLFPYSLVYMHYVGGSNTSCINSGSAYQCDVIDSSLGNGSMGAASLQVLEDGTTGIAYYKNGEVMYAYPHEPVPGWGSNCGPGGNTWRCISIYAGQPSGTVGKVVDLALGATSSERGIAFTYDDTLIPVTLRHAEYVGSGGNCGMDQRYLLPSTNKWQCDDVVGFTYLNPAISPSFSIAIDPDGYSVIAYNYAAADLGNDDLYIAYPNARVGNPNTGWVAQKIDGAPVFDVDTGSQAAIALDDMGRGFTSYLQLEEYEDPDIKVALQLYPTFLPLTIKP